MKKLLAIAFTCLGICIFIIIIGETFDVDYITTTIMIRTGVVFLALFFVFLFFGLAYLSNKYRNKVILVIIAGFATIMTFVFLKGAIDIFRDKSAYDAGDFEVVEGIPEGFSVTKDSETKRNGLSSFEIDGIELDVIPLDITEEFFQEKHGNHEIQVEYLPHSKVVVKIMNID